MKSHGVDVSLPLPQRMHILTCDIPNKLPSASDGEGLLNLFDFEAVILGILFICMCEGQEACRSHPPLPISDVRSAGPALKAKASVLGEEF